MKKENKRFDTLSTGILKKLRQKFPDIKINGHPDKRLSNNLNITIPGVENKALINILKDKLAFSSGSACATTKVMPSYVLKNIGLTDEETYQTIRIGLGRDTRGDGIADILIEGIGQLKSAPLSSPA